MQFSRYIVQIFGYRRPLNFKSMLYGTLFLLFIMFSEIRYFIGKIEFVFEKNKFSNLH